MRRRFCPARARGGPACAATDPPPRNAALTGRVAGQWTAVFRFVGHAGGDASFLDDFRSTLARAVTHEYAELTRDGVRYGFLGAAKGSPGKARTGPLLQHALYDAQNLHHLRVDSGDAPIGEPPVEPSAVVAALARAVRDFEMGGDDEKAGWAHSRALSWTGCRRGGSLHAAAPAERRLYAPERASTTALLLRAARDTGDRALLAAGREMVRQALDGAAREGVPLGKLQGQYLSRLHAAVALLAEAGESPPRPAARAETERGGPADPPTDPEARP